jgi:hypothetical protein
MKSSRNTKVFENKYTPLLRSHFSTREGVSVVSGMYKQFSSVSTQHGEIQCFIFMHLDFGGGPSLNNFLYKSK